MSKARQSLSDRMYGALLRILPFEFRLEFGSDMEETFRLQRVETAREHGFSALLRMWWATIADIVRMAPREHASVLWQDARYALRMMRKNPGYTVAAVMILGLGIGVNTSIFSAVNSVLLKPLPYLKGDDLVILRQRGSRMGTNLGVSVPEINDYRQQNRSLSGLVEIHSMTFTLLGRNEAHRVRAGVVSAGFFDLFGVKPLMGRTFVPDDDRAGAPPVLVLSYEYWKQTEGGDPNIVGKVFQMNDKPHTVIGVLPSIPQYPNENDVYMPTTACPFRSNPKTIANRNGRMMSVFGRLRQGVTMEQYRSDMAMIAEGMKRDNPKSYPDEMGFQAVPSALRSDITTRARPMLFALLGAAAFVLLIACANVANLTLARMARREQELVIRTAVGAGSGRLLRQLLTESLIMALLAAGIGMLFAAGSVKLLAQFAGHLTPRAREIAIDGWVLAFAVLCASATTIVFGSVAALYSRQDVASGLREGSRAGAEKSRRFVRSLLIGAQVAFSYVLLIGAGLMVRSLIQMNRVDMGFTPQRVLAVGFDRNWSRYNSEEKLRAFSARLLEKVQNQPGILLAAVSDSFPLDPEMMDHGPRRFVVEGDARPESEWPPVKSIRLASPDYFRTLGIPLLAGRTFLDSDTVDTPPVAVINRTLARQAWGNADPVGRRISFDGGKHWAGIIGVVGDTKEFGLTRETPFQVYGANAQDPDPSSVLVRTVGDPAAVTNLVRRAILDIDPENAITHVETLEQARADSVSEPRTTTHMFSLFAGLAFVIALAGIGSMLALWVRQRTREIGIRMAMGARPSHILGTVIRQGMLVVGIGLAAGYAGAVALTGFIRAFLFQVEPTDGATYAAVSALLLGAALIACYLPAMRAARIDPQVALRCD